MAPDEKLILALRALSCAGWIYVYLGSIFFTIEYDLEIHIVCTDVGPKRNEGKTI